MKIQKILKYKWRQLSSRQRLSPLPNVQSMEAISSLMEKIGGKSLTVVLMIFEERLVWYFLDGEEYDRIGIYYLKKLKKDPKFFHRMVKETEVLAKPFLSWIKKLTEKNLKKVSNGELAKMHERYAVEYRNIYAHYYTILTVEKFLLEELKELIQLRLKDDGEKSSGYLNIMITEPRAMVAGQEEKSALEIAVKTEKNKDWSKLFRLKIGEIEKKIQKIKPLYDLIKNHENKFFWITRDYEDPVLTFSDIISRIKNNLKDDPEKKLGEITKKQKHFDAEKKRIAKELKLTRKELALFEAMREGMHLKELRKKIVSESLYHYDKALVEIGRRGGLSIEEVRFLLIEEVEEMLNKKWDFKKTLKERLKKSAYFVFRGKTQVLSPKERNILFEKLVKAQEKVKELKGMGASPGKATGPVIIIMNPEENGKVKKGDIIVSAQVVPAFSPAISRAAGLVCDGGTGITSHSATLSREAGIPCVTGVKIATRVLKDGDLVEVDGFKGTVKIIKKK